jgi:hypothetical protein
MKPTSRIAEFELTLIIDILAAIVVCTVVTIVAVLLFVVVFRQSKNFWLWIDLLYYTLGCFGLASLAVSWNAYQWSSVEKHQANFIDGKVKRAHDLAASRIATAEFFLKDADVSNRRRQELEAAKAWFQRALDATAKGSSSDEWIEFLKGEVESLDSVDHHVRLSSKTVFAEEQTDLVLTLRAGYVNIPILKEMKGYPEIWRKNSPLAQRFAMTAFWLLPIAAATRFAKTIAELYGFKINASKA